MSEEDTKTGNDRPLPYYDGDVRIEGDALEFMLRLFDVPAPSGFEEPAADAIVEYATPWADEVSVDALGNVHVIVNKGASGGRRMLTGHIDEIGFIVTRVDDRGLLRIDQIGGWDLSVPAGQRVRVITSAGPVVGMIGKLAPHQAKDEGKGNPNLKEMWIDIGVATGDEAKAVVRIGDPVVLDTTPHVFDNRRVMSRSADDRIGAFIALEVARRSAGCGVEVTAMCATREEIGSYGVASGTFIADPDEAIALDVIWTSDVPGDHGEDVHVGRGPAITFGSTTRARVSRTLVELARDAEIDVQLAAAGRHTFTDADMLLRVGRGVPASVVSIPTRYLHSPGELFALEDAEAAIDLCLRWAKRTD